MIYGSGEKEGKGGRVEGGGNELAKRRRGFHTFARFTMPTYEYLCPKCDHAFEAFQSMNDAPLTRCPKCKKKGVKRLIGGGAGLIFKGTGFYITDYKNQKSPEKKAGGESPGGDKTAAKAGAAPAAKSEAKPAKAAAAK